MSRAILERCLGDIGEFLQDTWSRRPLLHQDSQSAGFNDLLSLSNIDEILTDRLLRYPDIRLIRGGEALDVQTYTYAEKQDVGPAYLVPDLEMVYDEFYRGATILLQGVHRYWSPLRALCREAEAVFGFPVQCNVFVTPGGAQGLATHIDLYDSVVLHTYGTKNWTVYEPTVPMPIDGTAKRIGESELAEPMIRRRLQPGDSLYIPRGFPHAAATSDSPSVHATLLIFGRSWVEVFSKLIGSWTEEEVDFREWLPPGLVTGGPALGAVVASKLAALSAWVSKLNEDDVAAWIAQEFSAGRKLSGDNRISGLTGLDQLTDDSVVSRRANLECELQTSAEEVVLLLPDRRIQMPLRIAPALKYILHSDRLAIRDLENFLDADSRKVLVRRLIREGLLVAEVRLVSSRTRHGHKWNC